MPYNLSEAFEAIEDELIGSMIRNLKRHQAEETDQGFQWEQWQALQLKALEDYRRRNLKKFPPRFNKLNLQIEEALRRSYGDGRTEQERRILQAIREGFEPPVQPFSGEAEIEGTFFQVNDRKLDALINATTNDMSRAEYAVLRRADDQYRQVIFNAQVYANTGAGTYKKAVDMAARDFLRAGLDCVEYKDGSRHTLEDYADMAIKTANKRAYLQGEGSMRDEWGIPTVIMNKRSCPCPRCAPFVGKVFIDDVWSGGQAVSGTEEGISPVTGLRYPLLSAAIKKGLYHPRCKDVHSTYFEGITTPPEGSQYTADELDAMAEQYEAQQKQGYCERQEKRYERIGKYSLDEDNQRMYGARAKQWSEKAEAFGNVINSFEKPVEKSAGSGIIESELGKFKKRLISEKGISKEYYSAVKDKFSHGSDNAKKAFNKYVPADSIADSAFVSTPHYSPSTKKISMNFASDLINPRGQGATWFHEHGHMIDDLAGNLSDNKEFYDLLQKEKSAFVSKTMISNKVRVNDAYRIIENELSDFETQSAVSDIFNGLSAGNIKGCGYHDDSYWTTKRVTEEAFAHMFEAQFSAERYAEMKKYFPKSLKKFEEILGGAVL